MYFKISRMCSAMFRTVSGLQADRMFQDACPALSFHIFCLRQKEAKFWHLAAHTTLHMYRQQVRGNVKPPYAEELTAFPDAILRP